MTTYSITNATLHVSPAQAGLFEIVVVTKDGVAARILLEGFELAATATEAVQVLSGETYAAHAAGLRLGVRLENIKGQRSAKAEPTKLKSVT